MEDVSGFLYARPSFWEGVARVLDLGGTLQEYNWSQSAAQADHRALREDWRAIGNDMKMAVRRILEEQAENGKNV